jgi:Secretion system C-terminal sorting domain
MSKILQLTLWIFIASPQLQAQSWADWEALQAHAIEKWFGIYPKNIEKFQTAHIKNWSNGDWKDSVRIAHRYYAFGFPKSQVQEWLYQGQWQLMDTSNYYYDLQNRWVRRIDGDSSRPNSILYNRFDTMGRLQTTRIEAYNFFGFGWQPNSLDSSVYAPSGLKTHHYHFKWNMSRRFWELHLKDSLVYDANGRLTAFFSDYTMLNTPHFDYRTVLDYTATGQLNFIRCDKWLQVNGNIVTVWDSIVHIKINYAYNAQNQMNQIMVEGKQITDNSSPIQIRYRFILNADNRVVEEIKDMIYIYRPPAWINLTKTVYTYYQTRTDEVLSETFLTVSPNPVRGGQLRVALEDAGFSMESVELYDLYGRNVLNQKVDNQQVVDLNLVNLNNGQYLLKVKTDKGLISKKVLILN